MRRLRSWALYRTRLGCWYLRRTLCQGGGYPLKNGGHGYGSEFGGCV